VKAIPPAIDHAMKTMTEANVKLYQYKSRLTMWVCGSLDSSCVRLVGRVVGGRRAEPVPGPACVLVPPGGSKCWQWHLEYLTAMSRRCIASLWEVAVQQCLRRLA